MYNYSLAGAVVASARFFTAASMMIAIPSGAQIFCWIATLWGGRIRFRVPLYFVLGFIAIFVLGGLTGVMLASVPMNLQIHDTFFVVAHLHYVLIGGTFVCLVPSKVKMQYARTEVVGITKKHATVEKTQA